MLTRMLKKNRNGRDRLKEIHDFEAKPCSCLSAKLLPREPRAQHVSGVGLWGLQRRRVMYHTQMRLARSFRVAVHCMISKSFEVIHTPWCNMQIQSLPTIRICNRDREAPRGIIKSNTRSGSPSRLCSMSTSTIRPKALIPLYIYPLNDDTWRPLYQVYVSRHYLTSE
jgi:hypothetical protein